MSFLYPILLLAGLASAIPVLLHLIRRREVHRLTFPAIRYLRQAEQRHARRLRLRHLALLATRVLLVLLLAAAAAGLLLGRGSAKDHRPTAVALLIDASLSSTQLVEEETLLDSYVERAMATLELAGEDDRIALFAADDPGEAAVAVGPLAVQQSLADLRPTAAIADLEAALRQASNWLALQEGLAGEIHLFTDLQAVSMPAAAASDRAQSDEFGATGRGTSIVVFGPELDVRANGIAGDPLPEDLPLNASRPTSISVPLRWFGADTSRGPVVVRLVVGDVLAVGEASFGEAALLLLPPQEPGWVQGYAEIDLHGLAADDRRYFSWPVRLPVGISVSGDPGEFVEEGVATLQRAERLRSARPADAQVWIAGDGEGLEAGLSRAGSVIVIPSPDPLDLPRLNSRLAQARVPWRYRPAEPAAGATRIAGTQRIAGLRGIEIRWLFRLIPSAASSDTVLLATDNGDPWLVRGTTAEGAIYLLLASPLLPAATDLPLTAAMVPFLDALIAGWARERDDLQTNFQGPALVTMSPRARTLIRPDGTQIAVEGGAPFRLSQPGNYRVIAGDSLIAVLSVNAPMPESDLSQGTREDLSAVLPDADWSWVSGASVAEWQSSIYQARRGRLAWRPLVVLILAVSIVEAALAAAGRRLGGGGQPGGPREMTNS